MAEGGASLDVAQIIEDLKEKDLYRSLTSLPHLGGKIAWNDSVFLNFSSNDYLDLATNAEVKQAAKDAIDVYGTGATGSRLMSGHLEIHKVLEESIAEWLGYEASLIFGSGFLTNLGVITSLATSKDLILFDKLNHASIIDGILMSGASWKRFNHNDVDHLTQLLVQNVGKAEHLFVIVDSVFSMDGDISPLSEIYEITRRYNTFLIVDEAHALGVFGKNGAGICQQLGIRPEVITGTLSKALGSYGGFAVCTRLIQSLLINKARSFIYSTALPPACLGASYKAMELLKRNASIGEQLLEKATYFYHRLQEYGLPILPFHSQIIPIMVGENQQAVELAKRLFQEHLLVKAIRPPTVPKNTARLRLSITLAHKQNDLDAAAEKIYLASKDLGVLSA